MMKYVLMLALSTSSCAKVFNSGEELLPYVRSFTSQYNIRLRNLPMRIVDRVLINGIEVPDVVGACDQILKENVPFGRGIRFKKSFWLKASNIMREQLVYHEMAHCIFNREHVRALRKDDKCPKSIMTPVLMTEACYVKHREELLKELPFWSIEDQESL